MTRRRQVFALTALGTGAALAAYALWLNFSYLIVPVRAAEQDIPIKIWRHTDYYKIYPGTYRSEKYGTVFTINSRGFRGAEFETGNDRVPRIVTLGDSSVIGNESAESSTWPRRLEHLLAERGMNVEVVNAGISGTMSKHHRALFHAELLHDRPALVIYYAGINDHRVVSVERYPGRRLWPQGRFDFFRRWRVIKAIQLRLLVLRATGIDIERWLPLSSAWRTRYEANLEAMLTEAKRAGITFVMVTQVLRYPLDAFPLVDGRVDLAALSRKLSLRQNDWVLLFRQADLLNTQRSVAARLGVKLVDLHQAFRDEMARGRVLFHDPVHLTAAGNELIASSLLSPTLDYVRTLAGPSGGSEHRVAKPAR